MGVIMKKFPSILFVFSLLFMLTACSSSADPSQESSGQTTSPSSQQDSVSVSNAVLESESTESEQSANNTLIVYFSRWGNTEYPSDVDAITSASIVVDNNSRYGTTEYVANMIAENVGGDLHRIETVTPYTADFDELRDVNHDEMSRNYLPELKESNLDISAYDTVFIGYPVWATDVPQAVLSFLKEYDLSGKTVIPFCTHDAYSKLYNIPSTGLRFFTVYGPAGRPDMAYFGFTNKLLKGETIQIFNYGNCKRDFTYVDDIVEGVVRVMQGAPKRKNGEDGLPVPPYAVYNIGNQNPENLLDFVQILQEELIRAGVLPEDYDFEAHKKLVPMQPGDVPVTYADTSALERDFGYKPSTSLREGLRKFAEWYAKFYK